jgi:hypothetical protein
MIVEVVIVNKDRGLAGLKTDDELFSILETDRTNLRPGEKLHWNGNHHFGSMFIENHTRSEDVDVYFQAHGLTKEQLRRLMTFD